MKRETVCIRLIGGPALLERVVGVLRLRGVTYTQLSFSYDLLRRECEIVIRSVNSLAELERAVVFLERLVDVMEVTVDKE